eukprot:1486702-Alexandrium_andersonii.AAC.1
MSLREPAGPQADLAPVLARQVRQVVLGLLFLRGQLRLPRTAWQQLLQHHVVVDVRHLLRLLGQQRAPRLLGIRVEGKQR